MCCLLSHNNLPAAATAIAYICIFQLGASPYGNATLVEQKEEKEIEQTSPPQKKKKVAY